MKKRIAIDVGHAAYTGAAGNGLTEHELNVDFAVLLQETLQGHGIIADCIDFATENNKSDLIATVRAINKMQYAASLSLHNDSGPATARGAHVCYVSAAGKELAEAIAAHLCPLLPGRASRTVKRNNLYVLNNTKCPAVLIERGFLTNKEDARLIIEEAPQHAEAIAMAVEAWLGKQ